MGAPTAQGQTATQAPVWLSTAPVSLVVRLALCVYFSRVGGLQKFTGFVPTVTIR